MNFRSKKINNKGVGSALDLTPVVDIVFNLLIFFALSLNFAAASRGIDIKLPSASSAKTIRSDQVTVNLTKEGLTFLNDKKITLEQLGPMLKEKADKKSLVIIRADSEVEHGRVVRIMDIIKSQDLNRIAIAVDVETQTEESKNN
ncbi:MAG: biopolymer transporter ExbD [Deltaproteobacteria bacterium]|nr:biopolymer transporter ExbD [Candidatus Dadabacteria bacterium]TDJ03473.1 MAG: biopolymer transporter ExbD [Deltaproteobacteria bacterium]